MTVSSTLSKVTYVGNGTTTAWSFPFKVLSEDEIELIHTDADDVESVVSSGYSVDGVGLDSGGSVTYPLSGAPLPDGEKLTIRRVMPRLQGLDLQNQGGFFPDVVESQLDRIVMMIQDVEEKADRSVKVTISSDDDPDQLVAELTLKASETAASAAAAAEAEANAQTARAAAETAREAAETAQGAAETAAGTLALPVPSAHIFIQGSSDGAGWEARSPADVRAAIGAVDVSGQLLAAGYSQTIHALGDLSGALTPDVHLGAMQEGTITGDLTIAAPARDGVMELRLVNDATGGHTVIVTDYTTISGEYDATAGAVHLFRLTRYGAAKCILEITPEVAA